MNKQKISIITLISLLFLASFSLSQKKSIVTEEGKNQEKTVSTQLARDSKAFSLTQKFPATLVSDGEVQITAKSSGTLTFVLGTIGNFVNQGALLATIDDTGTQDPNDQGLKSFQIKQSELTVAQAKKSYSLEKATYEKIRKSDSATRLEKESAKTAKEIAKLQYDNTLIGLTNTLDNHQMRSPIGGIIVNKTVSVGDSVAPGQLLFVIAQNKSIKAQFFVNQFEREKLSLGQKISALISDGTSVPFVIRNIAGSADQTTKKFLIEATPEKQDAKLLSGILIDIIIETTETTTKPNTFLLPISSITVGQNENSIFIVQENTAKKIPVTINAIRGEIAEISAVLAEETEVITDGNKLLSDGEVISIRNK